MQGDVLQQLVAIAKQAGAIVLSIYHQPSFQTMSKNQKDRESVLTEADIASHVFICDALKKLYPSIPIISEESIEEDNYAAREKWEYFFLVDPLDGTKEFIQRNDEFTINIALIHKAKPLVGVIHAPALGVTYYAEKNKGAYRIADHGSIQLLPSGKSDKTSHPVKVAISRSHSCAETQAFLESLRVEGKEVITIARGSALKFGLVAEGSADIYPRFAPTMEWDTAAGQVLVNEVGKQVKKVDMDEELQYNKKVLVNPGFVVW